MHRMIRKSLVTGKLVKSNFIGITSRSGKFLKLLRESSVVSDVVIKTVVKLLRIWLKELRDHISNSYKISNNNVRMYTPTAIKITKKIKRSIKDLFYILFRSFKCFIFFYMFEIFPFFYIWIDDSYFVSCCSIWFLEFCFSLFWNTCLLGRSQYLRPPASLVIDSLPSILTLRN